MGEIADKGKCKKLREQRGREEMRGELGRIAGSVNLVNSGFSLGCSTHYPPFGDLMMDEVGINERWCERDGSGALGPPQTVP